VFDEGSRRARKRQPERADDRHTRGRCDGAHPAADLLSPGETKEAVMSRTSALLFGLFACACSRQFPTTQMVAVAEPAAKVSCAADADCGSQQLCVDRMCYDVAGTVCSGAPIHFKTNSAAIDRRNRAELNQLAACLRSNRDVHATLAGNADERGNADYNRDLAQRRADATAGYLEAAGVPSERLSTVTYGTDDPLCTSHAGDCWRQNRRVDIAANNAGKSIKNKATTDDDTKSGVRIDGTGNGTDNGSPLGK
jgi:outer membrane protein OmpA-like peptidoglycan-associated protein